MGKKKKKKRRKQTEQEGVTVDAGAPAAGEVQDSPGEAETSDLAEKPVPEAEPEAAAAPQPSEPVPGETPVSQGPEEQPRQDGSATSERPGLLSRLTGWLGGGGEPAAVEVEPPAEAPLESVEEAVLPTEANEVALPEAEAVAEPSAPVGEGEDLKAEIARLGEQLRQKDQELESVRQQGRQEIEKLRGEKAEADSRVQALEAQLEEQRQTSPDLQKRVEELTRQLDAKDAELERMRSLSQETAQAREEAKRALSQLRDMEAALKQANQRAQELQTELRAQEDLLDKLEDEKAQAPAVAPAGEGASPRPSGKMSELYQQAVTPLTVLVASADLLVMDPGLDPSLRETASEMKAQSQALLELIKKYAGPTGSS